MRECVSCAAVRMLHSVTLTGIRLQDLARLLGRIVQIQNIMVHAQQVVIFHPLCSSDACRCACSHLPWKQSRRMSTSVPYFQLCVMLYLYFSCKATCHNVTRHKTTQYHITQRNVTRCAKATCLSWASTCQVSSLRWIGNRTSTELTDQVSVLASFILGVLELEGNCTRPWQTPTVSLTGIDFAHYVINAYLHRSGVAILPCNVATTAVLALQIVLAWAARHDAHRRSINSWKVTYHLL